MAKNGIWSKKKFLKFIYLISRVFLAWTFLNFLARCVLLSAAPSSKKTKPIFVSVLLSFVFCCCYLSATVNLIWNIEPGKYLWWQKQFQNKRRFEIIIESYRKNTLVVAKPISKIRWSVMIATWFCIRHQFCPGSKLITTCKPTQ